MSYPLSPFDKTLNANKILEGYHQTADNEYLKALLNWLCTTPETTYYKVNTLVTSTEEVLLNIRQQLEKIAGNKTIPMITKHCHFSDTIVLNKWKTLEQDLKVREKSVIVDASCGAAVLRGAHVFAPAVMGMEWGTQYGEPVSIFADISKQCKRGFQKTYDCPKKVFVGNGVVKMIRTDLFGHELKPKGVAVEVVDSVSGCPSIGESFLPVGSALLQNISSILCVHALDPRPGETVLDMCASPGHKTVHIAALMQNEGTLIAIDKTPSKIEKLQKQCCDFCANVHIFQADSTKIVLETIENDDKHHFEPCNLEPPFPSQTFDRILLDAPCSGLGQRPQLQNSITDKVLQSYIPLQRKLFYSAISLLKSKGTLVYSTCTVSVGENERMVSWALETFNCLQLVKTEPVLGGSGLPGCGLNEEQTQMVQRFGPNQKTDSVGFFIAKFIKL